MSERRDAIVGVLLLVVAAIVVAAVVTAARWGDPGMPTCPTSTTDTVAVRCAP